MMPEGVLPESRMEQTSSPPRKGRWYGKFSAILLIIFCAEVGLFLLIYPWTNRRSENLFASLAPGWFRLWDNAYVRGGVSGLGLLNLYICFSEIVRLWDLSRSR